jgi:peptidoglycan/xylan/chitin deacetylase (PgdA/CDA1 family)
MPENTTAGDQNHALRLTDPGIRSESFCPFYHCATDTPGDHVKYLFPIRDPRTFLSDLEFLARSFTPVTLNDLIAHAREDHPLPPRSMFLSFDDGLREIASVVGPLCRQVGVPATFFVNSASLDNRFLCFRHKASVLIETLSECGASSIKEVARLIHLGDSTSRGDVIKQVAAARAADTPILNGIARLLGVDFEAFLRDNRPYLTSEEVQTLRTQGFEIGAHSIDHPHYADLKLGEQIHQTQTCARDLKARFGLERISFAFPFTSDDVETEFFDDMLGRDVVDLIFCVGAMPVNNRRILQRTWMEVDRRMPAHQIVQHFYVKKFQRIISPV